MGFYAGTVFAVLLVITSGCFKKGSGKGSRATRPDFDMKGDIFNPGGDNKPGGDKSPQDVLQLLADCFGIPKAEVATPDDGIDNAKSLCDDLATVKYSQGTIINDADAVAFTD